MHLRSGGECVSLLRELEWVKRLGDQKASLGEMVANDHPCLRQNEEKIV
jgi:hypothetical protein